MCESMYMSVKKLYYNIIMRIKIEDFIIIYWYTKELVIFRNLVTIKIL